tara:strand:+ start:1816 stop:2118 length:303 start_codon:yes stop_codon:yes gene_type:complete
MTKLLEISKVLLEWSLKKEEWYISLLLYKYINIGIPNRFLYKMPQKNVYNSLGSVLQNKDEIVISFNNSMILKRLFELFKSSKWCKLIEWGDLYGYRYKF